MLKFLVTSDTAENVKNAILAESWQEAAALSAPRVNRKVYQGKHLHLLFYGIKSEFQKSPSRSQTKEGISQSKGV